MTQETAVSPKQFHWNEEVEKDHQLPTAVTASRYWMAALQILRILPTALDLVAELPEDLVQKHEALAVAATGSNIPVHLMGYAPVFDGTKLFPGQGTDWVMMNLSLDPHYYSNGNRLVAPQSVESTIQQYVEAGIDFDGIYIAHEIPAGQVKQGEPVPLDLIAPPPPPNTVRRMRFLDQTSQGLWDGVRAGFSMLLGAGRVAGQALATTASAAVVALPLLALDPVLFGVHFDDSWQCDGVPIGMWYYITHWHWPSEEEYR